MFLKVKETEKITRTVTSVLSDANCHYTIEQKQ